MADETPSYNLATIRKLLLASFTPEGLHRFCMDHPAFRPICDEFAPGQGLNDMVDRVISYCETQLLFGQLLAAVKEENPRQYAHFESSLWQWPEAPSDVPTYAFSKKRIQIGEVSLPGCYIRNVVFLLLFICILSAGMNSLNFIAILSTSFPPPARTFEDILFADGLPFVFVLSFLGLIAVLMYPHVKAWLVIRQHKHGRRDFSRERLFYASLNGAVLSEINLNGADLSGANLSKADLNGADLSKAKLHWANLHGADLRGANLRGANLSEAYLYKAIVSDEQLAWASTLKGATLPDGTVHE